MQAIEEILTRRGRDTVCLERPSGKDWVSYYWDKAGEILFIGAAGIAVRLIAPCLQDKMKDPAVVVMDEKGTFAIPILSGHVGGANELALLLAEETGSLPVLTTATDVQGKFAVDVFAKKQSLLFPTGCWQKNFCCYTKRGENRILCRVPGGRGTSDRTGVLSQGRDAERISPGNCRCTKPGWRRAEGAGNKRGVRREDPLSLSG